jgi:hypothetical protein
MLTISLGEIPESKSSVFLDNIALSSADRLLSGNYESVRSNILFAEAPSTAATLIAHDLINLAIVVESLLAYNNIYVNAEFVDRWNSNIASGLLAQLSSHIIGVVIPRDVRWEAESNIVRNGSWRELDPAWREQDPFVASDKLSHLVAHATHDAWSNHGRAAGPVQKEELLSPYDEGSRPFGGTSGIIIGTGFYVACSQALGIPYRPSAVRARLLGNLLERELTQWRIKAGTIALEYLEKSAQEAAESYFEKLATLNMIELKMPLVLGSILTQARSVEEVLPYALQLRELSEARALREWSSGLEAAVDGGNRKVLAKYVRELNGIVDHANRRLGIAPTKNATLSLGYGPVSVSKAFSVPAFAAIQLRLKSHAWLLQNLYTTIAESSRYSQHVEQILLARLPRWLQSKLHDDPIRWGEIDWRQ